MTMEEAEVAYRKLKTHLCWLYDHLVAWNSYEERCPTLSVEAIGKEIKAGNLHGTVDALRENVYDHISWAEDALDDLWAIVGE